MEIDNVENEGKESDYVQQGGEEFQLINKRYKESNTWRRNGKFGLKTCCISSSDGPSVECRLVGERKSE